MRSVQAPHSTESECALLGTLLASSGAAYDRVADKLTGVDFHHEQHQLIYRAIEALVKAGRAADTISVSDLLETKQALRKAGGRAYLDELAAGAAPAANAARYAEIIVERRMARQLMATAEALQEIAYEGGDVQERMARAQGLLMQLGEANTSNDPKPIEAIMAETVKWVEERHEAGETVTGVSTGLDELDRITAGLQAGDLVVLAARPSMGKTALAQTIAEHVSMKQGQSVLVFNMEMSHRQLGLRMLASQGSIDLSELMNPANISNNDTWTRMCEALDALGKASLFVDDSSNITPAQMLAKARRHKRKHGLSLIVVDYLQLMLSDNEGRGRTEAVGSISRALKLMAKTLGCPVLALSQLSRAVEQRADKRPMMSDLRESGSIEQDADVVMFLYRDDYYNPGSKFAGIAEAIIAKQRMGPTGRIGLLFQRQHSRLRNYSGPLPDLEAKAALKGGSSSGAFSVSDSV